MIQFKLLKSASYLIYYLTVLVAYLIVDLFSINGCDITLLKPNQINLDTSYYSSHEITTHDT
jgi:hypothetical protein